MTDLTAALSAAAEELRSAERIVVAGHIRPDGDALGSMLALVTYPVAVEPFMSRGGQAAIFILRGNDCLSFA